MEKHIEILRLKYDCGLAHRTIHDALGVSIGTICNVLKRARAAGIGWPLPAGIDAHRLRAVLYPVPDAPRCGTQVDHQYLRDELSKKGVTLETLFFEQRDQGYQCSYSQFCRDYRAWRERQRITMRQQHLPGDTVFVDFGGLTVPVGDRKAQIFVAALGASQYTFAKAVWSQSIEDWIECHSAMVEFYGGCPKLIVPDNLRSAVTRSCRYDPQMNRQFVQWAHHYSVCIMPARVRKPQDKSIAEIAVNLVQMKVLAPLRKVQFHSLGELNAKIVPLLDQANNRPFQKRAGSRAQVFETLDRPALKSLPLIRYQLIDSHLAKVGFDYHIYHQKHWYSVPYQFVGKTVEVQDCAHTVRISYGQDLIAMHLKAQHRHPNQTTDLKHMPQAHQHIGNWTPGRLLGWAARIGSDCHIWVQAQLERAEHFHKVSRLCIGVLSLSKKFGKPSLNRACRIANEQHIERLGLIKTIVTNDLNRRTDTRQLTLNLPQDHANVRGPRHFK